MICRFWSFFQMNATDKNIDTIWITLRRFNLQKRIQQR